MLHVPLPTAVTLPSLSTVHTSLSLVVHAQSLLSAFSGRHVALSQNTVPLRTSISLVLSTTDVTGCFTYILHIAVRSLPSIVLQRIVAKPTPVALTRPLVSTVHTEVSDDSHDTVLCDALRGRTSAVILN